MVICIYWFIWETRVKMIYWAIILLGYSRKGRINCFENPIELDELEDGGTSFVSSPNKPLPFVWGGGIPIWNRLSISLELVPGRWSYCLVSFARPVSNLYHHSTCWLWNLPPSYYHPPLSHSPMPSSMYMGMLILKKFCTHIYQVC